MARTVFWNARLVLEDRVLPQGYAVVENGTIETVAEGTPEETLLREGEAVDCGGSYLAPGFIDGHCHGGGGADFMDGEVEDILTAARAHMRHGTTTITPTTLTSSDSDLFTFFDNFEKAKQVKENMPHMPGVHLEGPYFSAKQAGAQPPEYLLTPTAAHYNEVFERSHGNIVRWSVAPELPGAMELGDELARRGILASIAHTDATYDVVCEATRHGYTHLTHFYSAMSSIVRKGGFRVLGVIESGYLMDELKLEIIADGMHLPPELLRMILKCKPHESISLVTDSMRGAAMPEGPSTLGSRKDGVPVIIEGGIAKLLDRSAFAGSVATTDRLVRVMVQQAGLPVWEAVRMISLHPARLLGLEEKTGSLKAGKDADLVIFDEEIRIQQVYVSGCRVQ